MEAPASAMEAVLAASFWVQFEISVLLVVDKLRPSLQLLSLALCSATEANTPFLCRTCEYRWTSQTQSVHVSVPVSPHQAD